MLCCVYFGSALASVETVQRPLIFWSFFGQISLIGALIGLIGLIGCLIGLIGIIGGVIGLICGLIVLIGSLIV